MAYSGKAVANEFLALAKEDGEELTNMKLQKLLFYAHGWHLAEYDGLPLLRDKIQAWKFGPVVKPVYGEFKKFGYGPITSKAYRTCGDERLAPRISSSDKVTLNFIRKIWNSYKGFTGVQLSNMTHLKGTPWYKAWHERGGKDRLDQEIPDSDMQAYFAEKLSFTAS